MTRADMIRTMNDDQLAEEMAAILVGGMKAAAEIYNLPFPACEDILAAAKAKMKSKLAEIVAEG